MLICRADNEVELHLLQESDALALLNLEKGWRHQPQVDEPMYPCQGEDSIKGFIQAFATACLPGRERSSADGVLRRSIWRHRRLCHLEA